MDKLNLNVKNVYVLMPVKVSITGDDCQVVKVEIPSHEQAQEAHRLIGHYDDRDVAMGALCSFAAIENSD